MIKSVRADRPAALFQFSDGVMQFYFDMHEGARPEEAHQYVNAPDVFCLEQQEQPLFGKGKAAESPEVEVEVEAEAEAEAEEAHQYVNAPDVSCFEQQEQPLFHQQPAVGEGEAAESHEKGEDEAIEIDGIRVSARLG